MVTKEGSAKIVYFMTRGAGVILLGRGYVIIEWKCIISIKNPTLLHRHRSDKLSCSNDDQGRLYQNF